MGYLSQPALKNLKKYSYKGVDESLVSHYLLTPYWNWFIKLFPLTIAPNTITLLGLCIVVFNVITLLYYDPLYLTEKDGAPGPPQWIYFTWAIGLFMYQSFDAVDGKQARRTGMAGPLGEMFDHGCDALNTTLEVALASRALNLGRSWWTVASQIATLASFYLTTWEEYHTGILYLGPFSGPVEGILMIVIIYIITGIFGPTFWDKKLLTFTRLNKIPQIVQHVPNIGLNESFMVFGAFGLAFNIISSYRNVIKATRSEGKSSLKPLVYLLPFVISATLQILWLLSPTYHDSAIIHSPLFLPFLCAWGLQFAHQVGRMILSHITRAPFPLWNSLWLWNVVGVIDAQLPFLIDRSSLIQSTPKRTAVFIYLTLAVSFITYARFCALVIRDITEFLGIACFTVRKKDGEGVWRETRDIQQDGYVKRL
ncbi:CDP-alcohol phosphatidyltransferase-domain-containing protein [Suillus bovinus]|uniref:CDP-alcohol phosphatidyltransferase-domain-containing protein n=1 Tax=Suillus bovinus TaxID=48563 RepID=UPI001B88256B|nr:CDP-alcohol phosphatidyltransferase-domain-containing protein [Suillus bovinus]KAG2144675.1 CDP-alcohol phosphatidyltransferase-domain-containing protein [Suillus bovinus]